MWPFMIKLFPVMTEPDLLLLHRHEGIAMSQRTFQRAVHAFMSAIFLRMTQPDAFRPDAQLYQPDCKTA
ncbi:hypothetical protein D3C75_1011630 [compost metagenome]